MDNSKLREDLTKLRILVADTTADVQGAGDADTGEQNPARKEYMSMLFVLIYHFLL